MATTTYLSNPDVIIATVNLRDQCTSAVLTQTVEALESTAFGDVARFMSPGLQNNELTLTLYMSYAATETYATLASLVGTQCNVLVSPQAPTTPNTYSATNPGFSASLPFATTIREHDQYNTSIMGYHENNIV